MPHDWTGLHGKIFILLKSSNVVNVMMGRRCVLQYVGETDVFPVAEHFGSGAHLELDVMVMVIELAFVCDPHLQRIREGRWIRTLVTLFPLDMNLLVDSR